MAIAYNVPLQKRSTREEVTEAVAAKYYSNRDNHGTETEFSIIIYVKFSFEQSSTHTQAAKRDHRNLHQRAYSFASYSVRSRTVPIVYH